MPGIMQKYIEDTRKDNGEMPVQLCGQYELRSSNTNGNRIEQADILDQKSVIDIIKI